MSRWMFVFSALVIVTLPGIAEAGTPVAAPEPASALLLAAGAVGLGLRAYRRRR